MRRAPSRVTPRPARVETRDWRRATIRGARHPRQRWWWHRGSVARVSSDQWEVPWRMMLPRVDGAVEFHGPVAIPAGYALPVGGLVQRSANVHRDVPPFALV